ncbi:MAG: UTP--glucose-1-phosphate uridylyltransferase [Puniceicoccales bacterium]|jgi:UDP-N-acetylglucosamine/UDP-N-acetylgalactosamine diphosphorylase|nr:UTP--glucose-1-phosphate uridylyltransferase [Puniceicoccales bacterium]
MIDKQTKELKLQFCKYGQEHVFKFWEILSNEEQLQLLQQAKNLNLDYLSKIIESVLHENSQPAQADKSAASITPAKFIKFPNSEVDWQKWKETTAIGEQVIKDGKVAAFTVAGGEGTRLGCVVPKGTLQATPLKKKSLFQIFAEKIKAAERKYETSIHWIIMTSERTHNETIEFFGKNDSFGIENTHFIKQGQMPAITYDGKIIMETKSKIAMHPDGHGGALKALGRSGLLAMLEDFGVEIISYFQVDNPLARCIDPYFIGSHVKNQSQVSSRMIRKLYPEEKVGVFCEIRGKNCVVEYSDLTKEQAMLRDATGNLIFCAGNTGTHLLDVPFIKQFNGKDIHSEIPYHVSQKAIPTVDSLGEPISPQAPNGLKLEMFIFDILPFAERTIILESDRLSNFSPIKNSDGLDSLKTCLQDQLKLFTSWLLAAGTDIPTDANGMPPFDIEISPMFADNKHDFLTKWERLATKPTIAANQYIE